MPRYVAFLRGINLGKRRGPMSRLRELFEELKFTEEGRAGITIHVGFLPQELAPEAARKLAAVRTAEDEFRVSGREFYWLCRGRTSDSKVWTSPAIKALRLPTATMRTIESVRNLVAKHAA